MPGYDPIHSPMPTLHQKGINQIRLSIKSFPIYCITMKKYSPLPGSKNHELKEKLLAKLMHINLDLNR